MGTAKTIALIKALGNSAENPQAMTVKVERGETQYHLGTTFTKISGVNMWRLSYTSNEHPAENEIWSVRSINPGDKDDLETLGLTPFKWSAQFHSNNMYLSIWYTHEGSEEYTLPSGITIDATMNIDKQKITIGEDISDE